MSLCDLGEWNVRQGDHRIGLFPNFKSFSYVYFLLEETDNDLNFASLFLRKVFRNTVPSEPDSPFPFLVNELEVAGPLACSCPDSNQAGPWRSDYCHNSGVVKGDDPVEWLPLLGPGLKHQPSLGTRWY